MAKKSTIQLGDLGADTLLGSLALLTMNVLSKDYISSFVPFVATLLANKKYDIIKLEDLCNDFADEYGFVIPRIPMTAILNSCAKKHIVERRNDGFYHVNYDEAHKLSFSREAKDKANAYREVVRDFCEYAKNKYDISITEKNGEEILFSFINENSSKTLSLKSKFKVKPENVSKKNFYIIAGYINHIENNDRDKFKIVQDIATGHIISSALLSELSQEKPDTSRGEYHSLVLYLDTPVILKILGLNTTEMQASYAELLIQLKARNNTLRIFQHTFSELNNILADCEHWIENPLYKAKFASPALKTFVEKKYTSAQIGLFIEKLESTLNSYGITIDKTDYYSSRYDHLQINDSVIRDEIVQHYKQNVSGFIYENKETTIERDVKSISSIYKLRQKKEYHHYKDAKYLFVTTNTALAYISKKSTKIDNPSFSYGVYPCITDIVLGTDVWISSPIDKVNAFSRKKLIADCSVAILPTEQLIDKLSESIESLYNKNTFTYEDYYLLKTHAFKSNYLINKTLNDENTFSDRITEEILEDIKNEIKAPLQQDIKNKEKQISEKDKTIYQLKKQNDAKNHQQKIQAEKEQKEQQEATTYAQNIIKNINNIFLALMGPTFCLLIAVLVIWKNNYLNNHSTIKCILNILSPALVCIIAFVKVFLLREGCKGREKLLIWLKNKRLIANYKIKLKDKNK